MNGVVAPVIRQHFDATVDQRMLPDRMPSRSGLTLSDTIERDEKIHIMSRFGHLPFAFRKRQFDVKRSEEWVKARFG